MKIAEVVCVMSISLTFIVCLITVMIFYILLFTIVYFQSFDLLQFEFGKKIKFFFKFRCLYVTVLSAAPSVVVLLVNVCCSVICSTKQYNGRSLEFYLYTSHEVTCADIHAKWTNSWLQGNHNDISTRLKKMLKIQTLFLHNFN